MICDVVKVDWKDNQRDGEGVSYRNDYQTFKIESEPDQLSDIGEEIISSESLIDSDPSSISHNDVLLVDEKDLDTESNSQSLPPDSPPPLPQAPPVAPAPVAPTPVPQASPAAPPPSPPPPRMKTKRSHSLSDGSSYIGDLVNGQFQGQGKYVWPSGDYYQ